MAGMTNPDLDLTITCGGAPLVIEGKIGGKTLFYRSRHDRWRIELDGEEIAHGAGGADSQEISEALRLIGKHCYRPIWDHVMERETAQYNAAEGLTSVRTDD